MATDQSLLKIYSDRTYAHTTMVRHQGTALAFAMDDKRRIVYTVLDLSAYDETRGELDAAYWSENPAPLPFPKEIVQVGYGVAGATVMPVVKRGGRTEAQSEEVLEQDEIDAFLSTTARLTAPAPFQVLSDGTHVVVLRQAVGAGHADAVYAVGVRGRSTGDGARADVVKAAGAPVPVVADTLLCDRFLLVGGQLKPVSEVRFKRSRHRTEPASAKDSLGSVDMDGRPFHEPTQELGFIRNLTQGRFAAVLVPTSVRAQQRWQFFAHNGATGRIDCFSVEQAADGLFNTQGSRYWTSPDAQYRGSVFEREPGTCPFTNKSLVPLVPDGRHAETAIQFNGTSHYLNLGDAPALKFSGRAYAVEAWIKPKAAGGPVIARWNDADRRGFQLRITSTGQVALDHSGGTLTSLQNIPPNSWAHVAASFDGTTATLYVDGAFSGGGPLASSGDGTALLHIGAKAHGPFFSGIIDEVRIWNRARGQSEIQEDRGHRLIGNEPGLAAYYRFDEGTGTTAYDQTDTAAHATLSTDSVWVTSEAPVGDHPGVRRDSFTFSGRDIVSGLSATLYYQQEETAAGYGSTARPAKRQGRVVLACATRPSGNTTAAAQLATLDLGVGADGLLADLPDVIALDSVDLPASDATGQIAVQEARLTQLQGEVTTLRAQAVALPAELSRLQAEISQANTAAENDLSKWAIRLKGTIAGDYLSARYIAHMATHLVHCTDGATDEWQIVPVPELPRVGHDVPLALVHIATGMVVESYQSGSGHNARLARHRLDSTLPQSAQWETHGDRNTGFKFFNYGAWAWLAKSGMVTRDEIMLRFAELRVEKQRIIPGEAMADKAARVAALPGLIDRCALDLAAKEAQIRTVREELARLSGGLLGAADRVLAMPLVAVDTKGLSSTGAVLAFARTDSTPFLTESAAGRVTLYYRGSGSEFFATYLDATVQRGTQRLAGSELTTLFTARDPAIGLSGTEIRVADHTAGGTTVAGLCDLTITRTLGTRTETERFTGVPRRAADLAAVVNGVPEEPVRLGTVERTSGSEVVLTRALAAAVPAPSYIKIGTTIHLVTTAAAEGATTLRLAQTPAAAPTAAAAVYVIRHDPARAVSSRPGTVLTGGSQWITATADKPDKPLGNGTATAVATGHGSRWRGDSPGRAFAFNGTAQRLTLPAARLDQITTTGDLTAEAWVNPSAVPPAGARVLQLHRGSTKAALALTSATLTGGVSFDGTDDWINISQADPSAQGSYTIECWIKRTRTGVTEGVLGADVTHLNIGFTSTGAFTFAFTGQTLTTSATYQDTDWHHWAVAFDRTSMVQTIIRDGVEVARRTATGLPSGSTNLSLGRSAHNWPYNFFAGRVAELRTWNTARSAAETAADLNRRISTPEPGLTGSWIFDSSRDPASRLAVLGPVGRTTTSWNNTTAATAANGPAAVDSPLRGYQIHAAAGDTVRSSRETYVCRQWAHLAAVYEQSWALRLDGSAWAETPDEDRLDITGDLTIEVFASIDSTTARQGLISKGVLGNGEGGTVPYQLTLLPGGKLEFAFEEPGPTTVRYTSTAAITTGFHRIAVVRRAGSSTKEEKKPRTFRSVTADGQPRDESFEVTERVEVEEWQDISFIVDGRAFGTHRYTGTGPRGNDGALEIGRTRDGSAAHHLTGSIGEIRIWGRARDTDQLGAPLQPRDDGLIARWTFEENTGTTTADPAGGHDLKLRRATWTTDADPQASHFTVYRNGRPVPCDTPATSPLGSWGDEQLTLGAIATSGAYGGFFSGTLEEVRLWRTARTPEQLLDSLFTRLKGDKQDLIAYWPFDSDSTTPAADAVRDHSPRGNHLDVGTDTTRPGIILSTAPVSTDTAAVRSALTGIRTPFHERITAPPAATEYADLQYTPDGQAQGVLKRAYAHITDGVWHLTTGYKIGDLITEWVSQVQYAPQLIGYIEGAPPVPSENLTGKSDPAGASSVALKEADKTTSVLGSAANSRVDMSFKASAKAHAKWGAMSVTAPLGLGVSNPIFTVELKGGVTNATDFSNTWTKDTTLTQTTTTDRNTSATLTGYWESPTAIRNTAVGKRYLPDNKGYALVQSETADVYALRLAHTGALVAYRMMPNPDIPKDWNIISFPINPQYTKQGTLDGAIGLTDQGAKILDEAYPTATGYGEYSYFKPREAYAIKRRIQRESQELQNFYASVSTDTDDPDPTTERAAKLLQSLTGITPATPEQRPDTESASAFADRDIANTYVWTADGGFFSEAVGTVDIVNETVSGSYTFTNKTTGLLDLDITISGAGINYQMEAMLGGGYSVTRRRSNETTRGHSLEVICKPNRDLQKYKADGTVEYDARNKPVLIPGKVDAYRFLTFYLGQDTTHFDDFYNKVIDPTWLASSTDANASALRQAQHSDAKPPCWRILHRVTFISRILPPVAATAPASLTKAMRTVDVQSNYELIRRLDPYVSSATTSLPELAEATRTALANHLPELSAHKDEITQFLADYYGVTQ
ncbi:LamG-like jellyroll fold domain-containing protein [Streptomyces sp. NPDC091377]|uniref:LamG-like jellyroll fold domain-containing protein n=1 Tax=Streptomyces sp. NPDC091377 TaxID=3365995 RepID=UPI00382F39F1